MIINLRGTSGSGKSHTVREIMKLCKTITPVNVPGRKRPHHYVCGREGMTDPLVVPGHYEADCGGCDTIQSYDEIFGTVKRAALQRCDVLYEGLLISAEVKRTASMIREIHKTMGYRPLFYICQYDMTVEECLDAVNSRRHKAWIRKCMQAEIAGKTPPSEPGPVNPKATTSKHRGVELSIKRLQDIEGIEVEVFKGSREEIFEFVRDKLFYDVT